MEVNVVEGEPTVKDIILRESKEPAQPLPTGTVCGVRNTADEAVEASSGVDKQVVHGDVYTPHKVRRRSDNLAAAGVIVTIGVVVCVLAGVVLYRKVNEIRNVEKGGGYTKIDSQGEEPSCTADQYPLKK